MEIEQFEKLVKEVVHKQKHEKSDPDVISISLRYVQSIHNLVKPVSSKDYF